MTAKFDKEEKVVCCRFFIIVGEKKFQQKLKAAICYLLLNDKNELPFTPALLGRRFYETTKSSCVGTLMRS